tara:strand:+ start:1230 stop:1469 length:240 start_codon:yes stop_codon:yes gene_type:complete
MLKFSKGDTIRLSFYDEYKSKRNFHETIIVTEVITISNGKTIVEVKWANSGSPDLYYARELEEKIISGRAEYIPVCAEK